MTPASRPFKISDLAYRIVLWTPLAWRSTARRRRFLTLGAMAPGYVAFATIAAHRNLFIFIGGIFWCAGVWMIRSRAEPRLASTPLTLPPLAPTQGDRHA